MGVSRAWGHVETADCIYWAGMQRYPSRPASTGEESEEANLAKCRCGVLVSQTAPI